ncbi:alkaline phosphatase [Chitinimonas sp. BJB300]|uniref:alkaline phosphatase n=1 Tax=Chitinimonas sp. BJB300 TaxID=1559339 RepID=UPI000C112AFF|nr:alkaline phosphatase [Chitinimonas sp. BJB300]PHV12070.1 alkaline phosphatase [Chitinimonas sp. BJB300]TSJ87325.1 alkaline phosphatase [Chitinimonas sp. BJB300]
MLKQTLITTALLAATLPAIAAGEAKNVIFFLGDGMGPTTITAARIYKYGEAGSLAMDTLNRTARIKTFSNDGQTTDSAPSMGAYMTGVKMNNEVISMSADTKAMESNGKTYTSNCGTANGAPAVTLLELAKAKGKAIGAVTTAGVTHATPASTYAHTCHRDAEADIATQAVPGGDGFNTKLGTGLDVLLGGGRRFWQPIKVSGGKRADGRDLTAEMVANGYTYVTTGKAFQAVDAKATNKLLGLFATSHMDFELDRVEKSLDQPSLSEMAVKAIDVLSKNANGYVLMVEGGRIDHALHGTNAKRVMEDTIAFDDAIKAVLAKVDLSNTLIVVTADHDHTMTINGYAKIGNPILDIVRNYKDGQPALDADGNTYTTLVFGNGPNRPDVRTSVASGKANASQALHDDYMQETGVRLSGETHGGGDVKLFAAGAGKAPFKGTLDNTKVFGLVKAAAGL